MLRKTTSAHSSQKGKYPAEPSATKGREARDVMIGLAKTCMKLKMSFYHYLGARLGVAGPLIPPLANLIPPAPA